MEISRVTTDGIIKWKFSARDIFVSADGEKEFEIIGKVIKLRDWQGYEYTLDSNGKEIS